MVHLTAHSSFEADYLDSLMPFDKLSEGQQRSMILALARQCDVVSGPLDPHKVVEGMIGGIADMDLARTILLHYLRAIPDESLRRSEEDIEEIEVGLANQILTVNTVLGLLDA